MTRALVPFLGLFLLVVSARGARGEIIAQDDTFEDFRSGHFDGAGANLFAGRKGDIRWVNWFDLDRDGWDEIVVNNDHNHYETPDAFLYRADRAGKYASLYSPLRAEMPLYQAMEQSRQAAEGLTRLPALGAGRSHVADLNLDGWPDLVFCNFIHGWSEAGLPTFVYWGSESGYKITRRSVLDAFRGTAAASADVNGDGLPDLIVSNAGREYIVNKTGAKSPNLAKLTGDREKVSYLFLQDETGFSEKRKTELPTLFAIDVKTGDFNKDGHTDVAFLEAGAPGRIRIFWNGGKGLSPEAQVLPVQAPTWGKLTREFFVGDLDGDGSMDIFAPSEGAVSEIFWNGPEGFSEKNKTEIPSANAYSAAAGDLDGDGYMDLVVANYSKRDQEKQVSLYEIDSTIFFGDGKRFAEGRRKQLPTQGATGVEVADVDGDSRPDVVFSQHRDNESFDIPSVIYRNSAQGFFQANSEYLGTFGAADVAMIPRMNAAPDLFFSNRQSGYARYTGTSDAMGGGGGSDSIPHMGIFWGNPAGVFGPGEMTLLPSAAPETSLVCTDIDFDGQADLVYLRGKGDELRVRFGQEKGFRPDAASFPVGFRGKSLVAADFNKDGYMDVVVTALDSPDMAFFAGREEGFAPARKFSLQAGTQSVACGDFDGDDRLDLAVVGKGFVQLIPGDESDLFAPGRSQVIPTQMFSSRVCAADLNGDGRLDLFVQNFSDVDALSNKVPSWVLYNEGGKFSLDRRLDIASFGATGGSVADVNLDGKPDLVISNYHGDTTRHISLFVYYAMGHGKFSDTPTKLPAYSSSGNQVLDLNNDGYPDIVVFNHSESTEYVGLQAMGGKHGTGSFVYWGGKDGCRPESRSWFPSFGPHARVNSDSGNILNRSDQETFTSAQKNLNGVSGAATMTVKAATTSPQNIACEMSFDNGNWASVPLKNNGDGSWTGDFSIPSATQLRYRLHLTSGNLGCGPVVEAVKISQSK